MPVQTPEQYYGDEANWGGYQFITMSDLMDDLMLETTDPDSYLVNIPRHKILKTLKDGIRFTNRHTRRIVHAIEVTVPDTGWMPLPQNYVDWLRLSVVDQDLRLQPLNINNSINTAVGYLQDHEGEILFDNDGGILEADSSNVYATPYKKYQFTDSLRGGFHTLDTSKLSRFGEFKIDEQVGTIAFSSNLINREIVMEYISDGVDLEEINESEIQIHKDLRDVIYEYTYSHCIATRRNVPYNEKLRAKNSFKTLLHQVKIDIAGFDMNQIIRVARTSTKMG